MEKKNQCMEFAKDNKYEELVVENEWMVGDKTEQHLIDFAFPTWVLESESNMFKGTTWVSSAMNVTHRITHITDKHHINTNQYNPP